MEPPREPASPNDATPADAPPPPPSDDTRPIGDAVPLPPPDLSEPEGSSPSLAGATPAPPAVDTPPPPVLGTPVPPRPDPHPLPDLTPTAATAAIPPPPPPGPTTLPDAPPPPPPPATTTRSKAPLIALALVTVAVIAGVVVFAVSGDDGDSDASAPRDRVEQDGTVTTGDGGAAADAQQEGDRAGDKATVEQTGAPDPADPQGYGDDAALDKLYDACKDGDMLACDQLYRDSGFGTTYEAFGDTCGNRNSSQGYCTDLYPASGGTAPARKVSDGLADTSANTYGDDPDLDRFWDQCFGGDMTACDSLYLSAPSGTEYEVYGATCGGRNEVQGYCSELYG